MNIKELEKQLWAAADKLRGNMYQIHVKCPLPWTQFAKSHELEVKTKASLEKVEP